MSSSTDWTQSKDGLDGADSPSKFVWRLLGTNEGMSGYSKVDVGNYGSVCLKKHQSSESFFINSIKEDGTATSETRLLVVHGDTTWAIMEGGVLPSKAIPVGKEHHGEDLEVYIGRNLKTAQFGMILPSSDFEKWYFRAQDSPDQQVTADIRVLCAD